MDTHLGISYLGGHETTRNAPEPGETSTPGGSPFKGGQAVSRRRNDRWCFSEFGRTVAAIIPAPGQTRTACEAVSRPNPAVEPATARALGSAAFAGSPGGRIQDQPLDTAPHRRTYSPTLRCQLHHTEYLEADAHNGLELSNTRQTGQRAERTGYPVLETTCMASHKKKPQYLEPIWDSSMRADSSLSQPSPAHGLPKGELRSFRQQATGRRYRPSPLSPSHRSRDGSDCTVGFTRTRIFAQNRSSSSSSIFSVTSEVPWFSCGTADSRIDQRLSGAFS